MDTSITRLQYLMDEIRRVQQTQDNREKAALWKPVEKHDWEPALIRTLPNREANGKIPFVVELAVGLWAKILDFDPIRYYQDPLTYAIAQLEMKLFHAKNFHDDTYIDKSFRLLIATALEATLMGIPFNFTKEGLPLQDYLNPPLKNYQELKSMATPSFRTAGIMPDIISTYERMTEALDEDFWVKFPDWIMGPFGVAVELRGFDKLLMDMLDSPENVNSLFDFIVRSRKSWQSELDSYLGIKRTRGLLGNDDVNCPTMSPASYRDLLLPVERELSEYYGGIFYWHSCGITTQLLEDISTIPVLDLFHCGPWTDVSKSCQVFDGKPTALEIMIEPVDKVQLADEQAAERHLKETFGQIPGSTNCYIKVDSIEPIRTPEKEVEAVKKWISTAREVLG